MITTCYKCDAEIEADSTDVHPLCDDCQDSFDNWLTAQLTTTNY